METGNLVHLEEYVDTIISLPHEIQRNLTMIKEHDSKVKDAESELFVDIDEFMRIQSKKGKEVADEERIELIKRIKNSFLNTLTHCEEKVSLSSQCYNSVNVEKHLIKMEEDLKCFEEEIRLSGYSDLLEKVSKDRKKQRDQVRNKKRQEAALIVSENGENGEEEVVRLGSNGKGENDLDSDEDNDSLNGITGRQKQKKQRPSNRNASNPATKPRGTNQRTASAQVKTAKNESDEDGELFTKVSRAERLLRRSKPATFTNETTNGSLDNNEMAGELNEKEDAIENQGDDEAESEVEDGNGDTANDIGNDNDVNNAIDDDAVAETVERESLNNSSLSSSSPSPSPPPSQQQPRRSRQPSNPPGNEPKYCTCNRESFGQMIACDSKDCQVEWFHYECVGLKALPKGKWFCKGCQEGLDARTAAQLAQTSGMMSTRSSRRSQ